MTTLKNILKNKFHTFLIDASGVIYNDHGPIPGIQKTIAYLQSIANVFVVTNNSNQAPAYIHQKFNEKDIPIPESHIISSAHSLRYDSNLNQLVKNKACFIYGRDTAIPYVEHANGLITPHIEEANVILLMASLTHDNDAMYNTVKTHALKNPTIPIICCNPDRYVVDHNNSLYPVMGYYAERLEKELGRPIHWVGKPHYNFSLVTKQILETQHISVDKGCLFFDDNLENVLAFENDLDISGCHVLKTGLAQIIEYNSSTKSTYTINTLHLN